MTSSKRAQTQAKTVCSSSYDYNVYMYVCKSTRVGKAYRPRTEPKRGCWQVLRKDGSGQKDTWGMTERVGRAANG